MFVQTDGGSASVDVHINVAPGTGSGRTEAHTRVTVARRMLAQANRLLRRLERPRRSASNSRTRRDGEESPMDTNSPPNEQEEQDAAQSQTGASVGAATGATAGAAAGAAAGATGGATTGATTGAQRPPVE